MQIKADVQSALICINLRFSFYINELFYGKTMIKYLVVGLGNIGPEYHETRHNIGFMTVEALARINNAPPFMDGRYGFTTSFSIKGRQLILLKPSTFMNLSGLAVRYWMQKENIPLENVLIVVDDLALPFGTLRLKGKGSDAGHNGLKHIAAILVLVTTSTHIYRPPKEWHDQSLEAVERKFRTGRAAIIGSACRDPEKLSMPETELFEAARKKADLTLIEADGARHLPCKAPAEHEPALLSSSDLVIGVTGLSALGQPLGKGCFRAERAAELLGCTMEHHITEEDLARLIASEQGQQKDLKGRTFYAVLHQYEEKEHRAAAEKLVELLRRQGIEHVLVTCATGNRRQSGENTNPWYGRAELPVREAEEEWEPGE